MEIPKVLINDDASKIYLHYKGLLDSNIGIDYRKVRQIVVDKVKEMDFDISEAEIKKIKITEIVLTNKGLQADSWTPLEFADIKIEKYIECELPY